VRSTVWFFTFTDQRGAVHRLSYSSYTSAKRAQFYISRMQVLRMSAVQKEFTHVPNRKPPTLPLT